MKVMVMAKGDGIAAAVGRVRRKLAGKPARLKPGDEAVEAEVLEYEREKLEAERKRRIREELDRENGGLDALKREGQRMLAERPVQPEPVVQPAEEPAPPPPSPKPLRRILDRVFDRPPVEVPARPSGGEAFSAAGRPLGGWREPYVLRREDGSTESVSADDEDVGPYARKRGRRD